MFRTHFIQQKYFWVPDEGTRNCYSLCFISSVSGMSTCQNTLYERFCPPDNCEPLPPTLVSNPLKAVSLYIILENTNVLTLAKISQSQEYSRFGKHSRVLPPLLRIQALSHPKECWILWSQRIMSIYYSLISWPRLVQIAIYRFLRYKS